MMHYECDVAVIGGGMGGVAAALAAARMNKRVVLVEPTSWLGGQMTSQGVAAFDEHKHIEAFGGTSSYYQLRDGIRATYARRYPAATEEQIRNPGGCWVSRLCFEPRVGLAMLQEMLAPYENVTVLMQHRPHSAQVTEDRVTYVNIVTSNGTQATVHAAIFLDATETGDLLPLVGEVYTTGTPETPNEVQSFTVCLTVGFDTAGREPISRPPGYERFLPYYTLTLDGDDGPRSFKMFEGELSFWTYRRLFDGRLSGVGSPAGDVVLINWASNDYRARSLLDDPQAAVNEASQMSLGFLHWLQTACPRDDGGYGYTEVYLRHDVLGTADGLAMAPYVREGRRLLAHKIIQEHEISVANQPGPRASHFSDSVGVGWYPLDLHPSIGNDQSRFDPTFPFQIPMGALLPQRFKNLLPACKNIGTTHATNGGYRLHPVEWNIGESAGHLAALSLDVAQTPYQIWQDQRLLRRFQVDLLRRGVPLAWGLNVPQSHPLFVPMQYLMLHGILPDTLDVPLAEPMPETTVNGLNLDGESWSSAAERLKQKLEDDFV